MSVNLAVLRIAIVVRIPVSGNRKNPRFLRFLGQVGTRPQCRNILPASFSLLTDRREVNAENAKGNIIYLLTGYPVRTEKY